MPETQLSCAGHSFGIPAVKLVNCVSSTRLTFNSWGKQKINNLHGKWNAI